MGETIKTIGGWVIWVASFLGACGAIWALVGKPLKKILGKLDTVQESLDVVTGDIGDILCDRLNQAHDYHMRKGWCPKADKTRLVGMHKRYTGLGRNHLAESYEQDLLRLPENPPPQES